MQKFIKKVLNKTSNVINTLFEEKKNKKEIIYKNNYFWKFFRK